MRIKRSGFTIIELLVVIAIIVILAAILYPAFQRSGQPSKHAPCQLNLKQIGLGLAQYSQDYDNRLPGRVNGKLEANSFRRVIHPYLKSVQIFRCPSHTGNIEPAGDSTADALKAAGLPANDPIFPRSYVCNGDGGNIGGTPPMGWNHGVSLNSIGKPAATVLVTESDDSWAGTEAPFSRTPEQLAAAMFEGHLGRANFLFADGHVKSMQPEATGKPVNMWNIEGTGDGWPGLLRRLESWGAKVG